MSQTRWEVYIGGGCSSILVNTTTVPAETICYEHGGTCYIGGG